MKIEKREYKTFTFQELKKEAREKALEELGQINVDYDGWSDWIIKDWTRRLDKLGYRNSEIYFSGFYSQGDGACFVAKVDILAWIKQHKAKARFSKLYKELENGAWAEISIIHNYHYYFATSTSVEYNGESELSDKAYSQLEEISKSIEDEREKLGNKIYKELKENYEYLTSEEAIIETIEANEYRFFEDGRVFNL